MKRALSTDWDEHSQIKTFIRWINCHIAQRDLKVMNLDSDFTDGVILINLLEVLTGDTVEKWYKKPKNRTYMIANNAIALAFMSKHNINLVNCSAQALTDGKHTIIMGTVWAIIRKFALDIKEGRQVLSISKIMDWCKSIVGNYTGLDFSKFSSCFQNGMTLCALLHKSNPGLVDYDSLNPESPFENLQLAFDLAEKEFGVPQLLDPADLSSGVIDERSLATYLSEFYRKYEGIVARPRRNSRAKKPPISPATSVRQSNGTISPIADPLIPVASASNKEPSLLSSPPLSPEVPLRDSSGLLRSLELPSIPANMNVSLAIDNKIASASIEANGHPSMEESDIEKVAQRFLAQQNVESEVLKLQSEINELQEQIQIISETYDERLRQQAVLTEVEIKLRDEKVDELERKLRNLEKFVVTRYPDELLRIAEIEKAKHEVQYQALEAEKRLIEETKLKMKSAQDNMVRARKKLEREKAVVMEEREKLAKDARLIFQGTVQELMNQGDEIEAQIARIKAEFQITKKEIDTLDDENPNDERPNVDEWDDVEEVTDDYYNESWWEEEQAKMLLHDKLTMAGIVRVQAFARRWLAKRRLRELREELKATIFLQAIARGWQARVLVRIIRKYTPHTKQVIKVQSIVRKFLCRRYYKMLLKRREVAKEILSTEATYVEKLGVAVRVYSDPMKMIGLVTREQTRAIFSEMEVILAYNTMLLHEIEKRMKTWCCDSTLSDIFLRMTDFLKVYTQYINNYNTAITTLIALKRTEKFAHFLQTCAKDPSIKEPDLTSFLILPIQRIPRYVLLLQELFKYTPRRHVDYQALNVCLCKMRDIASYVNEKRRDAENIHEVLNVQDKLVGKFENLALPHRRYLREGVLHEADSKKKAHYYLFNDLLLSTKKSSKPFSSVPTFKFLNKIAITEFTFIKMSHSKPFHFELRSDGQMVRLYADTQQDTESWYNDIAGSVEKMNSAVRSRASSLADNNPALQQQQQQQQQQHQHPHSLQQQYYQQYYQQHQQQQQQIHVNGSMSSPVLPLYSPLNKRASKP